MGMETETDRDRDGDGEGERQAETETETKTETETESRLGQERRPFKGALPTRKGQEGQTNINIAEACSLTREVRQSCLNIQNLKYVHPSLKHLCKIYPQAPEGAGRIRYFLENRKILTGDKSILEIVQGWKLALSKIPCQSKVPISFNMSENEKSVLDKEIN